MGAFDHVMVLLSFVFALALTHLLSRVGSLMLARKRVRFRHCRFGHRFRSAVREKDNG